ncbi:unnamed protein product [Euphydryas editha]|uniref:Uncharacterized protein n=1 Tax=Euphydryas editha TaxID=104508 RepID=A0AAU9TBX1_EUPED|nr:unnamed protein product [Euphydryas editha]
MGTQKSSVVPRRWYAAGVEKPAIKRPSASPRVSAAQPANASSARKPAPTSRTPRLAQRAYTPNSSQST